MKRFLLTVAVVILAVPSVSEAGIFSRRAATCSSGSCSAPTYYTTGQGYSYAPPVAYAPIQNVAQPQTQYTYPVYYQALPSPTRADAAQTMQATSIPVRYTADDGSGTFVNWINSVRASRGLRALVWSPVLAADAVANSARGFGHSFMGRARRQNVGMGAMPTVQTMWLQSPAHASAIFDPTVTEVGLGQSGSIVTLNLR